MTPQPMNDIRTHSYIRAQKHLPSMQCAKCPWRTVGIELLGGHGVRFGKGLFLLKGSGAKPRELYSLKYFMWKWNALAHGTAQDLGQTIKGEASFKSGEDYFASGASEKFFLQLLTSLPPPPIGGASSFFLGGGANDLFAPPMFLSGGGAMTPPPPTSCAPAQYVFSWLLLPSLVHSWFVHSFSLILYFPD